jgi:ligand-binding sensor domain-containing protein
LKKGKYKYILFKTQLLIAFVIILGNSIFSQVPFDKALRLGSSNGLENNWVTTVEEDEDGIAWLGTIEGFYRWDGISVESFFPDDEDSTTISSMHIVDVMPDIKNNKVWIASNAGLSVYNTISKKFINFTNDQNDSLSIPDRSVKRIFKDKNGDIWIGMSRSGLLRYSREKEGFEQYLCGPENMNPEDGLCHTSVVDIKDDLHNDSLMWLGTTKGVIKFNKYSYQYEKYHFNLDDKLLEEQYNNIRFITLHPNGKIYYAIWWYGICSFDMNTKEFYRINPSYTEGTAAFGRNLINGFHHENFDKLWINSNKGMQLFDIPSETIVKEYVNTDKNWYSIDHIDDKGRIWSATHNRGLYIFNPIFQQYKVSYYEEFDINYPSYTRKILLDSLNNKLYVASEYSKGLYIQDLTTDKWKCVLPPEDFDLKEMGGFRASDLILIEPNKLLIVESSGLFYYEPGYSRLKKYIHQPDKNYSILSKVLKDQKGDLWVSSYKGTIYRLNIEKNEMINYIDEISEISNGVNQFTHMCEDPNGNIWVNGLNSVLIYDRTNDKFIIHDKIIDSRRLNGSEQISADSKGRIWFGSHNKIIGYGHKDSLEYGILKTLDKNNGLKGKNIYMVLPHNDRLYVFSDNYIQVLNPEKMIFEQYIDKNYIPKSTIQFTPERYDSLFIMGTIRGVSFINLDKLKLNQEKPKPYVRYMHAFDEEIAVNARPGIIDSINLSYKQNFFSFEFSAINYNLPELTQFEYMLEGYDDEWLDGTKRRFASYTKVPGGEYRFLVKATNNEGVESETASITYLNITTVWWKAAWFITMGSILLASLIIFLYKYRIAQVRKDEQLK